jgi:hypothetical protein
MIEVALYLLKIKGSDERIPHTAKKKTDRYFLDKKIDRYKVSISKT